MYGGGQLPTIAERAVIKSLERISRLYVLVWTKKQFENEAFRKQLCYDNHNISLPELTANCCAFNFSGAVWSGRKNIIPVFCCMVFMNILLGLKPTLHWRVWSNCSTLKFFCSFLDWTICYYKISIITGHGLPRGWNSACNRHFYFFK